LAHQQDRTPAPVDVLLPERQQADRGGIASHMPEPVSLALAA